MQLSFCNCLWKINGTRVSGTEPWSTELGIWLVLAGDRLANGVNRINWMNRALPSMDLPRKSRWAVAGFVENDLRHDAKKQIESQRGFPEESQEGISSKSLNR